MDDDRFQIRYRDGYYLVIDIRTDDVVPPEPGHYKKHADGYLWHYAAAFAARDLNAAEVERQVRLEEAMNADLIEREQLRGITAPDY